MNMLVERYSTATPGREQSHSRLIEEIAYLEARLIAIGQTFNSNHLSPICLKGKD